MQLMLLLLLLGLCLKLLQMQLLLLLQLNGGLLCFQLLSTCLLLCVGLQQLGRVVGMAIEVGHHEATFRNGGSDR